MNDREYQLKLMRFAHVTRGADRPGWAEFVRGALRQRWTIERAADEWQALQERRASPGGGLGTWTSEWVGCRRCELCRSRQRVVFGRGSIPADVLLIGEAPGRTEDIRGVPFIGAAGELLDRALSEMGKQQATYYITNIVGCLPPDLRNPTVREVDACQERLDQTVRAVNPSAVVLVGAQPLFHLFALSLRTNRGKVLAWERHGDVPTIPTWHPAGILRSGEASRMKELRADLRQAATIARDIIPF